MLDLLKRASLRFPLFHIIDAVLWVAYWVTRALAGLHRLIMRVELWHVFAFLLFLEVPIAVTGGAAPSHFAYTCALAFAAWGWRQVDREARRADDAVAQATLWQARAAAYYSRAEAAESRLEWTGHPERPLPNLPPADDWAWR
jgi:hypothetical protein